MNLNRRNLLGASLAVTGLTSATPVAAAVSSPQRSQPGRRPNVLVIVLDDVGYADLGCYGSEIPTPAIDSLAAKGVRFTNFHTTPMCSPTRASLLTGRNPHSVGVGIIADWANENPGYRGVVDPKVPMLQNLLGAAGYGNYAVGKWHLNAIREQGTTGPFHNWPTRRGFDQWYGFQGAMADHWHPELFEGTAAIDAPATADYHLSADIVDRMTGYLADHVAGDPERPFFGYVAFGACHWPLHAPDAHVRRHAGKYDGGWSRLRAERFARQKAMGLIPEGATLPPENPDVPVWNSLPAQERAFAARCQEVYAGMLEHTDEQVGRLLASLDDMGVRDDTIVILLSDNGATAEGTAAGMSDVRGDLYIGKEPVAERIAALDLLGGPDSFPAYPSGWASAGNTPLRWYKSGAHEGGVRAPMIVSWPKGGVGDGGLRRQFHHVSDVVPTLFEYIDAPHPGFEGTSFRYALEAATAQTRKPVQLFEATGNRALWKDGWKAVARHTPGKPFDSDSWELFHLDTDFCEADDRAQADPARLAAMQAAWRTLAAKGQILPLDDRRLERYQKNIPQRQSRYVLFPTGTRLDRLVMPDVQRAHRITATLDMGPRVEGVLLAAGTTLRGYDLFVKDGEVHYAYVFSRTKIHRMRSGKLPHGPCQVTVELGDGTKSRTARLLINGKQRATVGIDRSWPTYALGAGLRCGANAGAPVSRGYAGRFPARSALRKVEIEVAAT